MRLMASVLALSWLLASPVAALASGVPDGGVLDFSILRNGEEIGRHTLRFEARGRTVDVRVEASVDFRFGFIPLYRFDHRAHEVWRDGALVRLSATTQDNGDDFQIEVRPDGAGLVLSVNGESTPIEANTVPASLWNIALVGRKVILDPADGEMMAVAISDAGAETITVRGRDVVARHYVMTGDFERDLWYDRDGVLMQVRFKGDDGSEIHYQLR
jgi:hypothetical protein